MRFCDVDALATGQLHGSAPFARCRPLPAACHGRLYGRLSLQLKAWLEGLPKPVYGQAAVHRAA